MCERHNTYKRWREDDEDTSDEVKRPCIRDESSHEELSYFSHKEVGATVGESSTSSDSEELEYDEMGPSYQFFSYPRVVSVDQATYSTSDSEEVMEEATSPWRLYLTPSSSMESLNTLSSDTDETSTLEDNSENLSGNEAMSLYDGVFEASSNSILEEDLIPVEIPSIGTEVVIENSNESDTEWDPAEILMRNLVEANPSSSGRETVSYSEPFGTDSTDRDTVSLTENEELVISSGIDHMVVPIEMVEFPLDAEFPLQPFVEVELAEDSSASLPPGLSKLEIKQLPKRQFKGVRKEGKCSCSICLMPFKCRQRLRTLTCNHEFHLSCIDQWLKVNRSCPLCRHPQA